MGSNGEHNGINGNRSWSISKPLLALVFGIFIGFTLSMVYNSSQNSTFIIPDYPHNVHIRDREEFDTHAHGSERIDEEHDFGFHNENDEAHNHENTTIADYLKNEVRILCWIMTSPKNHKAKAIHVKKTWGQRCNKLLFMSSIEDDFLGSIALPVEEGRDNLWAKTKEAFKYVHQHHLNDADWFLKADDDTFIIVENLRLLLYPYSPNDPIYFGCKFKPHVKQGYMSGGAGYVLSKEALIRFAEKGLPNPNKCRQQNDEPEDVEMGKCLANVRVKAGDSRDSVKRATFFPFKPEQHLVPHFHPPSFWFFQYSYYEVKEGLDCCSDNAISFHYILPNQMYVLDYLIYHLRPYGIYSYPQNLPQKKTLEYKLRGELLINDKNLNETKLIP